ncbi:hypothetical protein DSC_11875 [Pseudoxanthomonas spadix BD-a59]|uniref:Uncharacterized protein n=1 Tax=Pseudoxanthomonas spadix (strain BD-a59) TaxID=1045855 RepID=G7UQL6_PSEUP|nr:hypothetical protein [Pseudoxanthomonas spadix]AER57019.1 hypothetical protein DSC_11875 [Pseudoxanthomonas spadix BD-a59]
MTMITCIGKDGIERPFYVHFRDDLRGERRLLVSDTIAIVEDFFDVVLRPQGPTLLRVVSINNYGLAKYTHKGIPAAVLTRVAQLFSCRIESSPAMSEDQKDRRSEDATRMWEGMVRRGQAERYVDRDQFFIDPPSETPTTA